MKGVIKVEDCSTSESQTSGPTITSAAIVERRPTCNPRSI